MHTCTQLHSQYCIQVSEQTQNLKESKTRAKNGQFCKKKKIHKNNTDVYIKYAHMINRSAG